MSGTAKDDPTPPAFQRLGTTGLYALPSVDEDRGWAGYLLPDGADLPDSLSLDDAFNQRSGHYLFAPDAPPADDPDRLAAFIAAVWQRMIECFGSDGRLRSRVVLWLLAADPPTFGEDCTGYGFDFAYEVSGWSLATDYNRVLSKALTWSVTSSVRIAYRDGRLTLRGGRIDFFTSPENNGPRLDPAESAIPFTGPARGCFLMRGDLRPRRTLPFLGQGVRYTAIATDRVMLTAPLVDPDAGPAALPFAGTLDPVNPYNVPSPTADPARGRLRTLWALSPISGAGDPPPALPAWLRSGAGRAIALAPQARLDEDGVPLPWSGALVFQPLVPDTPGLTLAPAGDFTLAVAGDPPGRQVLLPGLFGLEGLTFQPRGKIDGDGDPDAQADRLRFQPNCPAHAPIFPFPETGLDDIASARQQPLLTAETVTAWATLVAAGDGTPRPLFLSQPAASPLYGGTDGQAAPAPREPDVLPAFPSHCPVPQQDGFAVPLAAYAGLTGDDGATLASFESQILSPARKRRMREATRDRLIAERRVRQTYTSLGGQADSVTATTPQGLLAEVIQGDAGTDYLKIVLARSLATGDAAEMAFVEPTEALQSAFQTNQLFLVAVDPAPLGRQSDPARAAAPRNDGARFDNSVTMAGWTMTAKVGAGVSPSDYRNVLVLKFCDGTLVDRVRSPGKWTAADEFSTPDPNVPADLQRAGLAQWLQDYIAAAIVQADDQGNALYRQFADIARDPDWNGILVLRATVDPKGFPDQIKGLVAGIDFSEFEAHHFGATVSRVRREDGRLTVQTPSSLFGLIDYVVPLYRAALAQGVDPNVPLGLPVTGDFGFAVLQLQALFRNAALVDFRSRVQLTTNRLFGAAITQTRSTVGISPANAVVLRGSYVSQGAEASYIFEQTRRTLYQPDSNVLTAIAFRRVQFNTLGTVDGQVASRFVIWGTFDFACLRDGDGLPVDLLSYGSPPGTPFADAGAGLDFANLTITLASPLATPNDIGFTFAAGSLTFDLPSSTVRANSLVTDLALQVKGFLAAPGDKRARDYDYLPVRLQRPVKAVDGPWYGVVLKVSMGGPGALVSAAGFDSTLLLSWAPTTVATDADPALFVGLDLPGAAPGAKTFSLQGVLKLAVDSLTLRTEPVRGGDRRAFTLRLNNLGLSFLGLTKLPPGSSINMFLFGDPDGSGALGWYAAYVQDADKSRVGAAPLDAPLEALPPPRLRLDSD